MQEITPVTGIAIRPTYIFPVPTAHEVKLFFDLLPDYSAEKLGYCFITSQIMRCTEICALRWHWLTIKDDKLRKMRHWVYKPMNRKTAQGRHLYYKEVEKPCYSEYLSDQLIGYAKRAPVYENNKLFPWTTEDALQKHFIVLRKKIQAGKLAPEYQGFLDVMSKPIFGSVPIRHRISPYSLRRFAFTFHYWVTFKQDIIALAKHAGHSEVRTTLNHYVQPKEAIGLTQEMIDANITIDQFIHLEGKKQRKLEEFTPEWRKRFVPIGQMQLFDFTND
jgi:integrase